MNILRELLGFNITTFGLTVDMAWMLLWPIFIVEIGIHWRFIKSFCKPK
jgi:hypothetical protein